MLKQMLSDDRSEAVREAVTKSLGLVVTYIGDTDKYEQVSRVQPSHLKRGLAVFFLGNGRFDKMMTFGQM